jgi:hypothetical protein
MLSIIEFNFECEALLINELSKLLKILDKIVNK